MQSNQKNVLRFTIYFLVLPILVLLGFFLFHHQKYLLSSVIVALISCMGFYWSFEQKEVDVREIVILAVLIALSITGRVAFSAIPAFKPVSAFTIITGIYFGAEAGFMVGSLSALTSNFYFGQGTWTPFQMFVWGMIGFIAGLLAKQIRKHRICLYIYGIFSGIMYSAMIDIFTVLGNENTFQIKLYLAALVSAIPFTIVYCISNVVFLLIFEKPLGKKLERFIKKYGLKGVDINK